MNLTETIPRVIRSHLELRGWTLTEFGERFSPPASCDQVRKWIAASGRDMRRLEALCHPLGIKASEAVEAAERLIPQPEQPHDP
jgi:hypothetical protein